MEGSVIGTSSASLILAHTGGAWLSTIGALCKYRLQPHQLRVQLAEPPGGSRVNGERERERERGRGAEDEKRSESSKSVPLRMVNR